MSAQLAQFNALAGGINGLRAGQINMTDQLSGRIDLQAATALIGQSVEVSDGSAAWDGQTRVPVAVRLAGAAQEVTLTVRDADGEVVRTIRTGALGEGDHTLAWDGALEDGSPAEPGDYTVEVAAVGPEGQPVAATPLATGTVDRLTVEADGVYLWIGDRRVPFSALLSVR